MADLWNEIGIAIPAELVESYWSHYRKVGAPWATWSSATPPPQHVPIALYGDECKLRPGEKMVGFSMSLLLFRPRSVRRSKFWLFAVQEELEYKRETMDRVLHFIVWALDCLHAGRYPTKGCDGEQLSGVQAERARKEIVPGRRAQRGLGLVQEDLLFKSSWKGSAKVPVCFYCQAGGKEPFPSSEDESRSIQSTDLSLAGCWARAPRPISARSSTRHAPVPLLWQLALLHNDRKSAPATCTLLQLPDHRSSALRTRDMTLVSPRGMAAADTVQPASQEVRTPFPNMPGFRPPCSTRSFQARSTPSNSFK